MSFLKATSFIFSGENSEDYNVVIGWMDSVDVSTNGLNRELKKSSSKRIKDNIYGSDNTEPITFTFCIIRIDDTEITREESLRINRWLTSSPLPKLLQFNDYDGYMLHYYAVCTKINDKVEGGKLIGKELTFETNSSFAFTKKISKKFDVTDSLIFYLNNMSDTYFYYPIITISTISNNVIIENMTDKKSVTLNMANITSDENGKKILVINCENMTITDINEKLVYACDVGWSVDYQSYVSSIDKYINNIYWFRLLQGINQIKITGDCTFTIECEFPRKAGCL